MLYNGQPHTSLTFQEFLTETQKRGLTPTPAQAGQTFAWGPLNASLLNPQEELAAQQSDNSVTLLVVYGDVRFLFSGDIGSGVEQTLLEAVTGTLTLRQQLPAQVLKVSRHGSAQASSAAFLEAVGAEVAIISVGAANPDGDPAQEALKRLEAAGARVLRTDRHGTLVVSSDGQNYEVRAERVFFDYVVFLPWIPLHIPPTATSTPFPPGVPTFTPTQTSMPTPT